MEKMTTAKMFLDYAEKILPVYKGLFSPENLNDIGIRPQKDGIYRQSQIIDFQKSAKERYDAHVKENKNQRFSSNTHPVIDLGQIKRLKRTSQIQAYNFSLFLFEKGFLIFTQETRDLFKIPKDGFKNHLEFILHFKKNRSVFVSQNIIKKSDKYDEAIRMFNMRVYWYLKINTTFFSHSFQNMKFYWELACDYIAFDNPFITLFHSNTKDRYITNNSGVDYQTTISVPKKIGNEFLNIIISVYPETTETELHQVISEEWLKINKIKESLPFKVKTERLKNPKHLILKWNVYHLYLNKYTTKEISIRLKKSETNIRKIISEVKKDIKEWTQNITVR